MKISQLNGNTLVDATFYEYVHTVGAVIFSFNDSFSPSALWGGGWSRITNRFLIGSGGSYSTGGTGGSADAVVVEHDHSMTFYGGGSNPFYYPSYITAIGGIATSEGNGVNSAGENGAGKNMPPYIGCNIWRKIA